MTKVNPKILEDQLREEGMYDSVWEDYISTMSQGDWTDWTEHPWEWYMERDIRIREGWHLVTVSPMHKDVTVIYYLKSQKAKFKHSKNEFLIQDEQCAIMVALKYA
jgi:hypothetical protein